MIVKDHNLRKFYKSSDVHSDTPTYSHPLGLGCMKSDSTKFGSPTSYQFMKTNKLILKKKYPILSLFSSFSSSKVNNSQNGIVMNFIDLVSNTANVNDALRPASTMQRRESNINIGVFSKILTIHSS